MINYYFIRSMSYHFLTGDTFLLNIQGGKDGAAAMNPAKQPLSRNLCNIFSEPYGLLTPQMVLLFIHLPISLSMYLTINLPNHLCILVD